LLAAHFIAMAPTWCVGDKILLGSLSLFVLLLW